jgi:hypothetical protein
MKAADERAVSATFDRHFNLLKWLPKEFRPIQRKTRLTKTDLRRLRAEENKLLEGWEPLKRRVARSSFRVTDDHFREIVNQRLMAGEQLSPILSTGLATPLHAR